MRTPGFAAPEMYRRDSSINVYAIGARIYACMQGYPPNDEAAAAGKATASPWRCRGFRCIPTT